MAYAALLAGHEVHEVVILDPPTSHRDGPHFLNVDRFLDVFGTKGAEKRAEHGSKGSTVFRDPTEENRVWALFDWDDAGWASFVSDPSVPPVLKEAGHLTKPQAALLLGSYGA